jgi:hypothetical protein
VRTFRWILVPALTLLVAGAAYACDKDKAGAQASAGSCSSMKAASASAGSCMGKTNAAMAGSGGCSAHAMKNTMADAEHNCPFCNLATEIRAQKGKVTFSTVENKDGVVLVFAAVSKNKDDVVAAQAIANKAYALMNAPAHCSYTSAQMADKSCQDCKEGMDVIQHASISVENTKQGAKAMVKPAKVEEMAKLEAFIQNLQKEVNTEI